MKISNISVYIINIIDTFIFIFSLLLFRIWFVIYTWCEARDDFLNVFNRSIFQTFWFSYRVKSNFLVEFTVDRNLYHNLNHSLFLDVLIRESHETVENNMRKSIFIERMIQKKNKQILCEFSKTIVVLFDEYFEADFFRRQHFSWSIFLNRQ